SWRNKKYSEDGYEKQTVQISIAAIVRRDWFCRGMLVKLPRLSPIFRADTVAESGGTARVASGHVGLLRSEKESDDAREDRAGPQTLFRRAAVSRRPYFVRLLPRPEARLHRRSRRRRRNRGPSRLAQFADVAQRDVQHGAVLGRALGHA